MPLRLDLTTALRQRLLSGMHLGLLRSGERLPSVRELAAEFGVSARVVLAAYRALEREGLVELRQRSGIFFGTRGRSVKGARGGALSPFAAWALDVFHESFTRGTTIPETLPALGRYLMTVRVRVAGIECNDDQIAALAAALTAEFGLDAVGLNVDDLLGSSPPSLDGFHLLVTTPFHAGEVQELAGRANAPWVAISYRADVFAEIARLLPSTPVYFVVTDPRFATKLRKIYASSPGAPNLRIIQLGDIEAINIPDGMPAFVSRTARERMAGHPILERVMPETRLVSDDAAREILSFIIRANAESLQELEVD